MGPCPVCGAAHTTCTGEVHYAGPGVTILDARESTLPGGVQIAQEQVWLTDPDGVLRLRYPVGARIPQEEAVELGIVDGRLQLRDKADVAPTEKARRRAQEDKARRRPIEDKALVAGGN